MMQRFPPQSVGIAPHVIANGIMLSGQDPCTHLVIKDF